MRDVTAIIMVICLAFVVQDGWLYDTGRLWLSDCWQAANAASSNRKPTNADEAIGWARCEPTVKRALFEEGFVFTGNPEYAVTPELQRLNAACPSNYSDIPVGGIHLLAIPLILENGGSRLIDRFTPPDKMIVRAFNAKWPNCSHVRRHNGFPKIVKKGSSWEFEEPCRPCEDEEKAAKAAQAAREAAAAQWQQKSFSSDLLSGAIEALKAEASAGRQQTPPTAGRDPFEDFLRQESLRP